MIYSLEKSSKIKKIIVDFGSSIFASAISIIALQIVVFPTLAKIFEASAYGELLTIVGIMNIVSAIFGNTLNNTRLIQNSNYIEKEEVGDFNILLMGANCISFIVILIVGNFIFNFGIIENLLISMCVVFGVIKAYISVSYRLSLNYKMILFLNLFTCIGYLFGSFLVYITKMWVLAFLFGELFACIFLVLTTNLLKEPYKSTKLIKKTCIKYLVLISTGLLANLTVYLDRFMIYPVLGSESVSIYTIASFFGKSLGLVMTPIAGVLLSYFAQKNFKMDNKRFLGINIVILLMALVFFLFAKIFSVWFTGLLYPTLIDSAKKYILFANTAAIIGVIATMATPFVLKYSHIHWQFIIELVYLIVYFGLSMALLISNGLIGFCVAAICANALKVFLLYFAGVRTFSSLRRDEQNKI